MIYIISIILLLIIGVLLIGLIKQKKVLKEIIHYTENLLNGNYSFHIINKAKGDIYGLRKNLNAIAEKLQTHKISTEQGKRLIDILFEGMKEGLILTKLSGEITQMNNSMKNIIGLVSFQAKRVIQELWLNREFIEFIGRKPDTEKIETMELDIPHLGRAFFVSRFYLKNSEQLVYLFNDITDTKNLKRIKAEFITNLSHELRTPLTAIKGYLEAIDEPGLSNKDKEKFLKIVRENIDRLTNIVSDLLVLSDIERPERSLNIEKIDINELVNDIIVLFRKTAEEKGLQLNFSPTAIPPYYGDRFMIEQLLINLISNGIRFTEKGKVEVNIDYENGSFYISVSDTGIGIPSDEIPRIFERFYTVDKARSRTQGGTGLGLSIVKHIVELHDGKIKVESTLGGGSKFLIILPIINSEHSSNPIPTPSFF